MVIDPNTAGKTVTPPNFMAHVVFQTNSLKPMAEFYKKFLNAHASYENDFACFLTYDEEHHRVAIVQIPSLGPRDPKAAGLQHMAFTYNSLEDFANAYLQRKANGIEPVWCVNHGPTTSMYYDDPDGNRTEIQVDNFDTVQGASEFMASKQFNENPIGTDFDPNELIRRLNSGEDHASIKKRVEIGPRALPVH
ncbi:hypothetical protein AYO21_10471 [Fonsecaea monophora]|uniref:VOC domain-containing protein n=1 Tax=Fonsecaea monophora TaxID=254056 RepID=A0A177EV76_9EURO|nr:hypothetical protein AYO21_10471 [Fonsecaea monophora]KAH0843315.1 Biphenyl-2,3-diol 1,2-dioxygenase 2 [Fonsecaea pedrosoi]OAG35331.1 hypothetical protein AYO21_10471 [Fonsecaea monophora]